MNLTAIFEQVPEGYIGYVLELPGANTQGTTLAETKKNLREAVRMITATNRMLNRPRRRTGVVSEVWSRQG